MYHVIADVMHHILSLSTAWDGSSVWDLPIDSMAQAPTIEQMQQYEKSKSAKVNSISSHFSVFVICLKLFLKSHSLPEIPM